MKGDFTVWKRSLRAAGEKRPRLLPMGILSAVFDKLYPLLALVLSARVADALGGDTTLLLRRAAVCVGAAALCRAASACLSRLYEIEERMFYAEQKQMLAERVMEMEYETLESDETREKMRMLDDMHEITGMRLSSAARSVVRLAGDAVAAVAAAWVTFSALAPTGGGLTLAFGMAALLGANVLTVRASGKKHFALYETMLAPKKHRWYYDREYLDAYRTGREIRVFRLEDTVERDYNRAQDDLARRCKTLGRTQGRFNGLSAALSAAAQGITYLLVGARAVAGDLSLGAIVQAAGGVYALYAAVDQFLTDFVGAGQAIRWLRLYWDFIDTRKAAYRGTLPTEKRLDCRYEIKFKDVSFRYPGSETYALRNVNLTLRAGEKLGLVGRNGSGKTTFVKLLTRLYDPTEGEITLNGVDIRKYNPAEYQALFAAVFQDFKLFSLPLGENVAANRQYDRETAKDCLSRAGCALDDLDAYLYRDFGESGIEISGGEAQKIALARALYRAEGEMCPAPYLVLDEPTAALDPVSESEIYARFAAFTGPRAAVYVSHRLSSCRFLTDIAVFDKGRIAERGSHESLYAQGGLYRKLWDAQARYYESA